MAARVLNATEILAIANAMRLAADEYDRYAKEARKAAARITFERLREDPGAPKEDGQVRVSRQFEKQASAAREIADAIEEAEQVWIDP